MKISTHQDSLRGLGFSLIELIVALAVLMLLISIGVPSFRTFSVKNLQASEVNSVVHHFHLARSLSVAKETHHILCPSSDGKQCTNAPDWSHGYIVYEDSNHNRLKDQNELLHAVHQPMSDIKINIHSSELRSNRHYVVYQGDGRPMGYNLTLTFCDPDNRIHPKAVILNNMGRVRVSDTRSDGTALRCNG
jgi:type IV fimbrial biogenesis protein FimT